MSIDILRQAIHELEEDVGPSGTLCLHKSMVRAIVQEFDAIRPTTIQVPGKIVGMAQCNGRVIVATGDRVYYVDGGVLVPIQFLTDIEAQEWHTMKQTTEGA